jgi:hypothetical protein
MAAMLPIAAGHSQVEQLATVHLELPRHAVSP